MQLRRFTKNHHQKAQPVDSGEFVAFWSDSKMITSMDRDGVEWMLPGEFSLAKIVAGDDQTMQIHRAVLVRVSAIDSLTLAMSRDGHPCSSCTVKGKRLEVSRRYRKALVTAYRAAKGQHHLTAAQVAA